MSARTPFTGRALLIEDNAVVALDAEDMLRALGFEAIDTASTITRAMEFIRTQTYSAALVDLQLRDGSAAGVIEALASARVPFVIASGYAEGPHSPTIAGAARINKPYDEHELADAMHAACARTTERKI